MKQNKNEELQTRREFFKRAVKGTLPFLGAIVLANLPLVSKASIMPSDSESCYCGGTCFANCHGSCDGKCLHGCTGCRGCEYTCQGTCKGTCEGSCRGTCTGGCSGGCQGMNY